VISRRPRAQPFPLAVWPLWPPPIPRPLRLVGDPQPAAGARCGEALSSVYWSRLSGPLLDRIDLAGW